MPALCENAKSAAARLKPLDGPRALVIQMARLGDFLQTTPLLARLRSSGKRVSVLVSPAQAPLARAVRGLDKALVLDPATVEDIAGAEGPLSLSLARIRGVMGPVWGQGMDEVYNLNLSRLCAAAARGWPEARQRGWRADGKGNLIGEKWAGFMMAMVQNRRLTRLHLTDILASYSRFDGPPSARLEHRVGKRATQKAEQLLGHARSPIAALQLGANNNLRRWPVESFALLARGLMDQGVGVALVGSARERVLGRRLKRTLGAAGENVLDLMGATSLGALGAVLARCGLVVSADTGTLHLATAVGTPVLALYMGPAQAHETGPYGAGHLVLQARGDCGPCQEHNPACRGDAPCRRLIGPAQALKAALCLISGQPPARAAEALGLPREVDPLAGEMDGFGQTYRLLRPAAMITETGLALALREAGRMLLRPSYHAGREQWAAELAGQYIPPVGQDRRNLSGLAQAAGRLAGAAAAKDAPAAQRILQYAPGLANLGGLVGPNQPENLSQAAQLAAQMLEASSSV